MEQLIEEFRNKLINVSKFPIRRILSKADVEILNKKIDQILTDFQNRIIEANKPDQIKELMKFHDVSKITIMPPFSDTEISN